MKNILFVILIGVVSLSAHDHIEVGVDPEDPERLALSGPDYQLALYVPRGEPFSGDLPQFPGGWHACELTFTTQIYADELEPADGADPRIEILSVTGPVGEDFAFWEVEAIEPTWSLPTGWSGLFAGFPVVLNGHDHVHGRAFTMDKPGIYMVTFRAIDDTGQFEPSVNKTVTFNALQPPKLSISLHGGNVALSFTSRANLNYDLQVCTDLGAGIWRNVEPHIFMDGDGGVIPMTDLAAGRPRAFYRLVEYQ
jgi:hypothetical protein